MIWDLPGIAGFAEAGGWRGNDLAEAVAVAVAASGGDDAVVEPVAGYDDKVTVGLWQVPASASTGFDVDSLLRPALNAAAAHLLWNDAGRTWAWSAAWGTPGWGAYLGEARAVVASGRRRQPATEVGVIDRIRGSAAQAAAQARLTAAQLSGLASVIRHRTPR